jgi:hypothetical protein
MIGFPQNINLLPNGCIIPCDSDSYGHIVFNLQMNIESGYVFIDYINPEMEESLSSIITSNGLSINEQRKEFIEIMLKVIESDHKTPIRYTNAIPENIF